MIFISGTPATLTTAVLDLQILDRRLQPLGGKLQRFLPTLPRPASKTAVEALTATPAADGAHALRKGARVGGHDVNVLQRDFEPVGADLGEHGLAPLILARRAGPDLHLAGAPARLMVRTPGPSTRKLRFNSGSGRRKAIAAGDPGEPPHS